MKKAACKPPIPGNQVARRPLRCGKKDYFTPLRDIRVPLVAPWRALNFGFDLQMTYTVPLRLTTWQSAWRRFEEASEERTFMVESGLVATGARKLPIPPAL